jgi:class 3 adenylate cyclase/tetratricopeptide (TPR) repeat protein
MKCPKCQTENREARKFCFECGAKLVLVCVECGFENLPGEKFCGECGHAVAEPRDAPSIDYDQPQSYTPKFLADKILTTRSSIEGERKLVTVLFADVANYTSISEKLDPEEVHQIMDGCFKILMDEIHRYEGTINQFTGDGVMALFGAPVGHEDHAQRACHAALSIQKALGKYGEGLRDDHEIEFKMRIGLNSGNVVVGSIGDDLRMDYTAIGDTTNLASRMEGIAKPGQSMVSENTYTLARDFFEFKPLGKVEVKGKKEALESYELIKPGEVETRIEAAAARGLSKFIGRSREMETLKETLEKTQSGSGQVIGVVGEAGVGKSRLLLEMRNMLPKGEHTYLEGRCLHYGGSMAYLPILDILRSYFDIKEGDIEADIKEKINEKTLQLDERLKTVLPPFQEILSLTVDDGVYLQLEPAVKKIRTFEAIRDLLVRLSETQPLVLAVEDLHWIDKTSDEFLGYLIDSLANTHILLILFYRPEYTHPWGSKSQYSKIGVDQLSTGNSVELVEVILEGGDVVPELRELILGRAGGNPLFVEELTQSLLENGSIQKKEHEYILSRKASEIEVPDTLQGIIAARIDRVEESLKRIMQVASVIGREFAFRILQTIMGMRQELKSQLLNLQGLEFISEKQLFPELEYIFKHAFIQEVAYKSLLHKRRKELHERIGMAVEEIYPERIEEYYELLAYHYGHSANTDKAVEYLDRANQKAIKLSALEDAMAYFDEAMKLLDTMSDTHENRRRWISLLVNQWIVFLLLFKYPDYHDLLTQYEPMAIKLDDPGLLGAFYDRIGGCEWVFGYTEKSIQTVTKAAELCEGAGDAEGAARAYMTLQVGHLYEGDYHKAITLKEDILGKMEQQFDLRTCVYAFCWASLAYQFLGRWDLAVEEGKEALRVAEEYSDSSMISFALWIISVAYTQKWDLDRAIEYGDLAVQKAPTPADKLWAQYTLAWAWCRAGETQRGIETLAAILPMFQAVRFRSSEVGSGVFLGEGYWLAGEHEKARQTLEEALELAERCGYRYWSGQAQNLLGEVALETNPAQAAPRFDKSIAVLKEIKAENELAMAYAGYGRLHKQQGNIAEAREYLSRALKIFERLGTLIQPDKVREELAGLPECLKVRSHR